jgi:hypothetical protein
VDDVENLRRLFRFVGLQMADEMVAGASAIGQLRVFSFELLQVVFAEVAQPERVGVANRSGREFLGDGYQLDVGTLASGACRSLYDARLNFV